MDEKPVRTEIVMVYWDCGLHGVKGHLHQTEDVAARCMKRGAASKIRSERKKGLSRARRLMALRLFLERGSYAEAGRALGISTAYARAMAQKAAREFVGTWEFVDAALQAGKKDSELWLKKIDKAMKIASDQG
jgi:hypothetical protein